MDQIAQAPKTAEMLRECAADRRPLGAQGLVLRLPAAGGRRLHPGGRCRMLRGPTVFFRRPPGLDVRRFGGGIRHVGIEGRRAQGCGGPGVPGVVSAGIQPVPGDGPAVLFQQPERGLVFLGGAPPGRRRRAVLAAPRLHPGGGGAAAQGLRAGGAGPRDGSSGLCSQRRGGGGGTRSPAGAGGGASLQRRRGQTC